MREPCQFYHKCPTYKFFEASQREVFVKIYCKGDYSICQRRIRRLSGQDVPENMLPSGNMVEALVPRRVYNDELVQMVL